MAARAATLSLARGANTVRVKIITGSLVILENLFPEKITVTVTVLKFGWITITVTVLAPTVAP